ncbi:MAG: hypothetical protein ABIR00_08050 [Nitrosospira sp.]
MGDQNIGKLNRLLAELGDTQLVSSRWLRAHDYSMVSSWASTNAPRNSIAPLVVRCGMSR